MNLAEILKAIAPYRALFLAAAIVLFFYAVLTVFFRIMAQVREQQREEGDEGERIYLEGSAEKTSSYVKKRFGESPVPGDGARANAIRQILAPGGVDPSPNTYLCLSDAGREVFVRSVTISQMPKRVRFAETFRELLSFPGCTSSIFVEPIDNETISRKIDRQINILESEEIGAEGQTNRVRKLSSQVQKTTRWAHEVEDGDKKFFNVGFLFTFYAKSIDELNFQTDEFRALALKRKMDVSNCFASQSEAFIAGYPLNRCGQKAFSNFGSDCVKTFLADQAALSVVLNYTSDHYTHRRGIPLGRNLFNGLPFLFDLYDPSHFGYTLVIAGKTFSGKSATIKMMIERYVPLGYRFVIIDCQARKGTSGGEYASCVQVNGGVIHQVSAKGENVINPFDVQESIEFVQESANSGYERRTLDLNTAVTDAVYLLRTMIRGNIEASKASGGADLDVVMDSTINDILTEATKELYEGLGIVHGDADSLYEEGATVENGVLHSGIVPKLLPTVSDLFLKVVKARSENADEETERAFRFIISNLRENVRELYYTDSGLSFSREEFEELEPNPAKAGERLFDGEAVHALHGIRPYYDGQSTFAISRDCPVTSIDISQLRTEAERRPARNVALHLVDSGFVKKNSERLEKSDKLVVVIDEAHESFGDPSARILLANEVRTARKLNVGLIFSTQTIAEFSRYPETKDILEQSAVKMVFKQDVSDVEELTKPLNVTESQASVIMNRLGVVANKDDPEERTRHRGEMCVIDGGQVQFVKVDYLKSTEKLSVETDASSVMTATKRIS
jgi:hypothetical protein